MCISLGKKYEHAQADIQHILFSGKPLRASEGIRYDAGLFGRGDKRSRTIFDAEAGA
jgi:hypothetical protein